MAVLHTQPRADHSSITRATVKPYGELGKVKPTHSRMVRKLVKPSSVAITPVFVGIAG